MLSRKMLQTGITCDLEITIHSVFFWLMDNPMAILSAASLSRSACNLSWVDPVNAASSAYRILFMFCPPMLMPGKCSIFRKIISSYKFQKSGDMTQPCLTPLLISTKVPITLLIFTAAVCFRYIPLMILSSFPSTSRSAISSRSLSCCTVSKALV